MGTFIVSAGIVLTTILFLITPFRFGRLPLEGSYRVNITVNGQELTATMLNSRPSMAFKKLLQKGTRTIPMRDYGSMEKVGMLWRCLPTENRQITAEPGDLILYMGSSLVLYYESNSWTFTRLGHIDDITGDELRKILGTGKVRITFSLTS